MKLEWTDQHNFEIGECDSCGKHGRVVHKDDPKIASFHPIRQNEEKYDPPPPSWTHRKAWYNNDARR